MVTLPSASGTRGIIAVCHQVTIALLHMMKRLWTGLHIQNAEVVRYFINQNPVMESVLRIARTPRLTARVVDTRISVGISTVLICAATSAPGNYVPVGVPHCQGSVMSTVARHKMITVLMMSTVIEFIILLEQIPSVQMAQWLADQTDVTATVTTPINTA